MAWNIDAAHSHATFAVRHMVVSTVRGNFGVISGTLNIDDANPGQSWVDAQVETTSISTGSADRDNHLRSGDFFDVEKYPTITFKSNNVTKVADGEYKVTGDLTIRDITKPVTFDVEYSGQVKDPYGLLRAGLHAATKINRKEWGLTWNAVLEAGGAVVADEVKLDLDVEAVTPINAPAQA